MQDGGDVPGGTVQVLPMSAAPGRSSIVGVLEVVQTVKVMDVRFLVNMLAPILAVRPIYMPWPPLHGWNGVPGKGDACAWSGPKLSRRHRF